MSFYSRAQLSTVCLCPLWLTSDSARSLFTTTVTGNNNNYNDCRKIVLSNLFHLIVSSKFLSLFSSLSMIAKIELIQRFLNIYLELLSTMARNDNSQYESNCAGGMCECLCIRTTKKRGKISDNHYFMAFCLCVYYLILITCLVQNKVKTIKL